MKQIVAFPSEAPGGLEARLSAHFGHCDAFTLVTFEDGQVSEVSVLPNQGHVQGGCLVPVQFLAGKGAQALVAGGMGMRPLMGFQQAGIEVFHNGGLGIVAQAVQAFTKGLLPRFGQNMTCGGGEAHGSGGCGAH